MPESAPPLAVALRLAGHDLPPETIARLDRGHVLLQAMLARLHAVPPATEPATIFTPDRQA